QLRPIGFGREICDRPPIRRKTAAKCEVVLTQEFDGLTRRGIASCQWQDQDHASGIESQELAIGRDVVDVHRRARCVLEYYLFSPRTIGRLAHDHLESAGTVDRVKDLLSIRRPQNGLSELAARQQSAFA